MCAKDTAIIIGGDGLLEELVSDEITVSKVELQVGRKVSITPCYVATHIATYHQYRY